MNNYFEQSIEEGFVILYNNSMFIKNNERHYSIIKINKRIILNTKNI